MSITNVRTIGVGLCLFIASAASASATTYVVSEGGGGQFTDIQPAIDAAQPGDILLVLQGTYGAFTLDKGLTIIGYGNPPISGGVSILGVPAGETAAVVSIKPSDLSIVGCMGPVLVQDVGILHHIDVQQCSDVRLWHVDVAAFHAPNGPAVNGCDVNASRLELVSCSASGSNVQQCAPPTDPTPVGGIGMALTSSSRVQLALSQVQGGSGSLCSNVSFHGGDGGAGVELGAGDVLFVTGGGSGFIGGGDPGGNDNKIDCSNDDNPGVGIHNGGGQLWYSGAVIECPGGYEEHICLPYQCTQNIVGPGTAVTPDDPTLDVQGNPTAGGSELFTLRAPPGATAILYFGRHPIVVPTPHVLIEQLTQKSRIVNLGTIPASGQASFTWPIAAGLQPGTLLIAQAELTLSPGQVRRTNSVPVVLR